MNGQSLSSQASSREVNSSASWLPASYRAHAVQEDVRCGSLQSVRPKRTKRHFVIAVVLALAFGPIGVLYASESGAIMMAMIDSVAVLLAHVPGLLFAWAFGAILAGASILIGKRDVEDMC